VWQSWSDTVRCVLFLAVLSGWSYGFAVQCCERWTYLEFWFELRHRRHACQDQRKPGNVRQDVYEQLHELQARTHSWSPQQLGARLELFWVATLAMQAGAEARRAGAGEAGAAAATLRQLPACRRHELRQLLTECRRRKLRRC
jgi:hypothetical protein